MRILRNAIVIAAAMALGPGTASAFDQSLFGKRLVLKTPESGTTRNKLMVLSKGNVIQPTSMDPTEDPTLTGARLHVTGDGGDFTISLPAANWSYGGNFYRYRDTSGTTCKIVLVKANRLVKARCKGPQVAYTLGAPQGAIQVVLATGTTRRFCHRFDDTPEVQCDIRKDGSDGETYLAMDCGNTVLGCPSPSGAFLDESRGF